MINNRLIILIKRKNNTKANNSKRDSYGIDNNKFSIKIKNINELAIAKNIKIDIIIRKSKILSFYLNITILLEFIIYQF